MDEKTKNYRKAELNGVTGYEGQYNLKVIGAGGSDSKWLSIDENEMTAIQDILTDNAVTAALNILKRKGYIFKLYGAEDVQNVLLAYMEDNTSGVIDTQTYRDEITRHVMEGDDWTGVLDTDDTFAYIWSLIEGTHHDHPEWFPEVEEENPLAEKTTPELVDRYVTLRLLRATPDALNATALGELFQTSHELRRRGIIE